MRVFAAVELPEELRARVAAAARELLAGIRAAKPVAAENLHVTLRFVGDVPGRAAGEQAGALAELCGAIGTATASVAPSVAELRGFGAFPNARRPRIVWAGIDDPSGVLAALEGAISSRLEGLGYVRESRPYSAHLTVARLREGARDLGPLSVRLADSQREPPAFGGFPVKSVTVFDSELGRNGSRYTALACFPLDPSMQRDGAAVPKE